MALTAGMQTALAGQSAMGFNCMEIVLPSGTVRLLDGASEVVFSGMTFVGLNATYGSMGEVEAIEEAVGTDAPRLRVIIYPINDAAVALWTDPTCQWSLVRYWSGVVDFSSGVGLIVTDPQLEFYGRLDTARISVANPRTVQLDVATDLEMMFAAEEGFKLNDTFHQSVWTGELGLQFVTGLTRQLFWGSSSVHQTSGGNVVGGFSGGTFTGSSGTDNVVLG